jgi:hypothetical protein
LRLGFSARCAAGEFVGRLVGELEIGCRDAVSRGDEMTIELNMPSDSSEREKG